MFGYFFIDVIFLRRFCEKIISIEWQYLTQVFKYLLRIFHNFRIYSHRKSRTRDSRWYELSYFAFKINLSTIIGECIFVYILPLCFRDERSSMYDLHEIQAQRHDQSTKDDHEGDKVNTAIHFSLSSKKE